MVFLDFCAAVMRNRHLARQWLRVMARGAEMAQSDGEFARICSSYFGGLEIRPFTIMGHAWMGGVREALQAWPRVFAGERGTPTGPQQTSPAEPIQWQAALAQSMLSDPAWHLRWTLDVGHRWSRVLQTASSGARDRRADGVPMT
jgi:hypothetical protein